MNLDPEGWAQIWATLQKGGSLKIPLLLLSIYAYYVGFELFFRLRQMLPEKKLRSSPDKLVREPEAVDGVLGDILAECMADGNDREETRRRFRQVQSESVKTLNRIAWTGSPKLSWILRVRHLKVIPARKSSSRIVQKNGFLITL